MAALVFRQGMEFEQQVFVGCEEVGNSLYRSEGVDSGLDYQGFPLDDLEFH